MDIKQNQLLAEQKVVLQTLAESAAKPACKFLEIGSWIGDSAIVLAKVAQQHGGHLFCVDWWKGNAGTDLADIAVKQDIFSLFWSRICREGLDDIVIPIRSSSDVASKILKKGAFEIVFIDADHRYEAALRDIKQYAPLVSKKSGILCGHDCEGRISDFDKNFLISGKDVDFYESVHCGLVLAVGSTFKDYSINYGIWSVRATSKSDGWESTNLRFPGIKNKRQPIPPPIASTKNYDLFRYGKSIYAAPHSLGNFDVTNENDRGLPTIVKANSLEKIKKLLGEKISSADYPILQESDKGYNFVQYKNRIFALSQTLRKIELRQESENNIRKYQKDGKCIIGNSLDEAKRLVEQSLYKALQKNLDDRDRTIAALQADASKRNEEIERLSSEISQRDESIKALNKEISDRDGNINKLNADISELSKKIDVLKSDISQRDKSIEALNKEISLRDKNIDNLSANIKAFNKRIDTLQSDISQRNKSIEALNKEVSDRDGNINKLNADIKELNKTIVGLKTDVSARDKNIVMLSADINKCNKTIDSLRSDISASNEDIAKLKADVEKRNNSIDSLRAAVSERDESIKALNNEISKRDENIAKLNTEAAETSNYVKNLIEEMADIKSKWYFRLLK